MRDNGDTVSDMTDSPHDPRTYSTTKKQLAYMQEKHEGEDADNPCVSLVAAEAADLICESLACEGCRPESPAFIAQIVTEGGPEFTTALVLSLAASLVRADATIAEGHDLYNRLSDEEKAKAQEMANE